MRYISTRGYEESFSAAEAILMGIAPDGGLFVPETIPVLDQRSWESLVHLDYQARAQAILEYYTEFPSADLSEALALAYSEAKFDPSPAPLVQLNKYVDDRWMLELWHGPTAAFKDLALQLLPHLMRLAIRETGSDQQYCILTATSGDTGKAALEGFKDVPGTSVIVFYPTSGVSQMQRLQMQTQRGENVHVFAVRGSFDDAQTEVKKLFADETLNQQLAARDIRFSSANSINWGRLLPQVVYYCSVYLDLLAQEKLEAGETFDVVVPSGNFGNILAAWYAKQMGAPIGMLYCASNRNRVLADFLREGQYNRKRDFYKTNTPSMDILVSSNLERLLFELTGHNAGQIREWMTDLTEKGQYTIDKATLSAIQKQFRGGYADERIVIRTIRDVYHDCDHVVDTHTAVGFAVHQKASGKARSKSSAKTVYVATASPFKFPEAVMEGLYGRNYNRDLSDQELLEEIADESGLEIPAGLAEVFELPILHDKTIKPEEMRHAVLSALNIEDEETGEERAEEA